MKRISLADVTLHIDEAMSPSVRAKLENDLRSRDGVIGIQSSKKTPHLMVVTYDPDHAKSKDVLKIVLGDRLHAELIGI